MRRKTAELSLVVLLLFFVAFIFASLVPRNACAQGMKMLRVGISFTSGNLIVSISQGDNFSSIAGGQNISLQPGTYSLENSGSGIRIMNVAGHNCGIFSEPLLLEPASGAFQLGNARNGRLYGGSLEIGTRGTNALTAINIIELESYLRGVVPREIQAVWGNDGGMEALKALAVAARTFALANDKHREDPFQLCDGECCQVYGGMSWEAVNTNQAVAETRGVIITFNAVPIKAYYHATNGGFTECPANVWSSSLPYLRSEPDPFDDPQNTLLLSHPEAVWVTKVEADVFANLLAQRGVTAPVGSVGITSVFPSGRVNELRINAGGTGVSLFKGQARTALGLSSQLFGISQQPGVWLASAGGGAARKVKLETLAGTWVAGAHGPRLMQAGEQYFAQSAGRRERIPAISYIFAGQGRGHGVGMSKYGAFNRARAGHSYAEILSFYYPGTQLTNLH